MDFYDYNADVKKTSVKVHHGPGGASNFSLSHEPDNRFNRGGPGSLSHMSQQPDASRFQKTANKNQSNVFGGGQEEDPRYPRKKNKNESNLEFGEPVSGQGLRERYLQSIKGQGGKMQ